MSTKDEMKSAGVGLGHAFRHFGKTFLRSVGRVTDKVTGRTPEEESVFQDGSWRNTGKELGSALLKTGKATLNAAADGLSKAADAIDGDGQKEE